MPTHPAPQKHWTPEEYLARERASETKHEFFRGQVFAMAGGTHEHNLVAANLVRELGNALRRHPCLVYASDMRVKVEATGLYTYPDVTVLCGAPRFEDAARDTLLNPQVIFEVLSDSTESYDRGRKFEHYRKIPSLAEVALVSQHEVLVEHYARQADGAWVLREYGAGQRLPLPALGCEIEVEEIYSKVWGLAEGPMGG